MSGVAQRVPGGLGSQISWHSPRDGVEVVSLTHRPPLPPGMYLVLIFTRGWVDPSAMVRSEGSMSLKNPVTPPRTDPGAVRLVAQRLNHYTTPDPIWCTGHLLTYEWSEDGWSTVKMKNYFTIPFLFNDIIFLKTSTCNISRKSLPWQCFQYKRKAL
jgi:hypothetical protein